MEKSISELSLINLIEENQLFISDLIKVEELVAESLSEIRKALIPFPADASSPIEPSLQNISLFSDRVSTLKNISTFINSFKLEGRNPNAIQSYESFSIQLNQLNHRTYDLTQELRLFNSHLKKLIKNIRDLKLPPSTSLAADLNSSNIKIISEILPLTDDYRFLREQIKNLQDDDIYIVRLKEETKLLIEEYKNEITNLTEKFENQFKKFELSQIKITKSSELLSTGVDSGLKNLADLNERTQNIELEFSKIIKIETENVKDDLNASRSALNDVIQDITTTANTKLNEITKAHTAFINLVSNAGIYKLTENYDKKATEEKTQYETYRTYTSRAIGAAIVFTVIILTIPLIEYWGAVPAVDTNYYTILARLTISLMFFVLALYFSKQASKHYECYQDNHRTFLQLAALEPFMANMTPEEKQEIRKSLVPSYFNQGSESKFATKGDDVDMSMMFTFMDKLSNFAQNKKDSKSVENTAAETKPSV